MKIRTKLLVSFIFIAGISTGLATFSAIYSISEKYEEFAVEETITTRKSAEGYFYDYMGDLTRKTGFLAELNEVVDNVDKPDDLTIALESKSFFLVNVAIKVISPDNEIIATYDNYGDSIITRDDLDALPFFKKERDPLIRDAGVFRIKNRLCMLVVAPIVDPGSFTFKGYALVELYLNSEFADYLKEKAQGDIIIMSEKEKLASTFLDDNGQRYFPEIPDMDDLETEKMDFAGQSYLITGFPISDQSQNKIGDIYVVVNIKDIIIAKQHGIYSILLVLSIVVLVILLISFFIGKKLTDSIRRLSLGAEALSRGEFDVRIESSSRDEIGQLTDVFNNMTESLKAQRDEILALKLYFEKIIENSPSAIIICDVVSHAITINTAAEKLFGIDSGDIQGKEIFDIINLPLSLQADFYQVILSGNPITYDSYRLSLNGGDEKIFRLTFYEVSLRGAQSIAIQIEDVTKSLKLEEELTHAQKLGTLGEVLGRFTHEFNNLMTGIVGHISLLLQVFDKNDKHYKRLLSIDDLATKARNLGKNVLSFSKKGKMDCEKVEVGVIIDSVLNLVEKTVFKGITIEKDYPPEAFYTMANREKISLALLNLMINAKDALREIEQEEKVIAISVVRRKDEETTEKFLEIRVSDNGTGIEEKIINRIFEPYFTTKGKKGTGLGLATVKDIIEKSGGTISVDSVLGKGTTFIMTFPEVD